MESTSRRRLYALQSLNNSSLHTKESWLWFAIFENLFSHYKSCAVIISKWVKDISQSVKRTAVVGMVPVPPSTPSASSHISEHRDERGDQMAEAAARRGREMERNGGRPSYRPTDSEFSLRSPQNEEERSSEGRERGTWRRREREGGPTKPFSLPLLFKSLSPSLLLFVSLSFVPLLSRSTVADFSAFETDPPSPRRRPTGGNFQIQRRKGQDQREG